MSIRPVRTHSRSCSTEKRSFPDVDILQLRVSLQRRHSEVAADASGKVTATFVERGQKVKQGDTLAILDARGAAISASQAAAQTVLARAQLEQAQKDCDRVKALFQSGAISGRSPWTPPC